MSIPDKVKKCKNHYPACECIRWRYEQMERALKIISVWADSDDLDGTKTLRDIVKLADKALNYLGTIE